MNSSRQKFVIQRVNTATWESTPVESLTIEHKKSESFIKSFINHYDWKPCTVLKLDAGTDAQKSARISVAQDKYYIVLNTIGEKVLVRTKKFCSRCCSPQTSQSRKILTWHSFFENQISLLSLTEA